MKQLFPSQRWMVFASLIVGLVAGSVQAQILTNAPKAPGAVQAVGFGKHKIIGYFMPTPEFPVSKIVAAKAQKLTHINYAFVTINNGQVVYLPEDKQARANVRALKALKQHNPNLKICASLGGWADTNFTERSKNNRQQYEAVLANEASRNAFAANVKAFMANQGFDCFDIDMEHPGWVNRDRPDATGFKEAGSFDKLLKALKKEFAGAYELSIAATGSLWFLQFHYPFIESWSQSVDYMSIMSYDLAGSWDRFTGFNAPIYSASTFPQEVKSISGFYNFMREADFTAPGWGDLTKPGPGTAGKGRFPDFPLNVDTIVKELTILGVPKHKMVLGVPFYGRAFKGVPATNNGVFQPHTTENGDPYTGDPTWLVGCDPCAARKEPRTITYAEIKHVMDANLGYQSFYNNEANVPYLYNPAKQLFITYDDPKSIRHKAAYVMEQGLGGAMFWHLGQDSNSELFAALHGVLNGNPNEASRYPNRAIPGAKYDPWIPESIGSFNAQKTYQRNDLVMDGLNNVWRAESPNPGAKPNGNTGWRLVGIKHANGIAFHPAQVEKFANGDMQGMNVVLADGGPNPPTPPTPPEPTPPNPPTPAPKVLPGQPVLDWMSSTAAPGETRLIKWNMWWGQRGEKWRLKSYGAPITPFSTNFTGTGPLNEQGPQSGQIQYTFEKTASLQVELCNGSLCTAGPAITVTVSGSSPSPTPTPTPPGPNNGSAPGQPVLDWMSNTATVGESRLIKWNMWWGQRGDKWRLKLAGNPVTEFSTNFVKTGSLSEQGAQSGQVQYQINTGGILQVELCNGSVCTTGPGVNLTVTDSQPSPGPSPGPAPGPGPSPSPSAEYPCTGVKLGKIETVTPACLSRLETLNFGGPKHIPGNVEHLPMGTNGKPAKEALGYFAEWSVWSRKYSISSINAAQYSKILFSFLRLMPDGSLKIYDESSTLEGSTGMESLINYQQPAKERGHMLAMTLLKARHPHIKTAFSVGGWTLSGQFSGVTANPVTRAAFVRNLVEFANQYGFDGIDIDWEYPVKGGNQDTYMPGVNYIEVSKGNPADAQNYVLFLQELRAAVNAESAVNPRTRTGKKEISIAVGLNPNVIDAVDYASILPSVDTINLMSYDFNGGWSKVGSHNAPFYNNQGAKSITMGNQEEHPAEFTTYDGILNVLWNAAGQKFKRKKTGTTQTVRESIITTPFARQVLAKMVVGVPYYGRSWTTTASRPTGTDFTPWFIGTSATVGSFENAVWDSSDIIYLRDGAKQKSGLKGRLVMPGLASAQWQGEAWDQYACANLAWISANGGTQLVSYNDEDSVQHMARFVADKNLAGTMVWSADGDTHGDGTNRLSKSVMYGLNKQNTNINGKPLKTCVAGGRE